MIRALILGLGVWLTATAASANCRQALALGLDVSGSVDSGEYRLQIDGLAAALTHPDVIKVLLSQPDAPVHLAIFEWSAPGFQRLLLDWTAIAEASTVTRISAQLTQTARATSPPGTALGNAMEFGAGLLANRPDCWKRTLDISGDGKHNMGSHPRIVRDRLQGQSLTLNALVIGVDDRGTGDLRQVEIGELSSYFNAWVITGPGAFVETALGFDDYESAMVRKLKRELESIVLSSLNPLPQ